MDSSRNINDPGPRRAGFNVRIGAALLCVTVLAILVAPGVSAQPADPLQGGRTNDTSASYFGAQKPGVGIKRATAIARKHTGGRVLSASPRQAGQVTHYRVRVLVDGERVVTVTVNQDGEVIRPN